jgi:hypothetical protein
MMCRNIVLPVPLPRSDSTVCIDLTSPWSADSRFGEIQSMRTARRRFGAGALEMNLQEINDPRIAKVARDDTHHRAAPSAIASD